MATRWNGQWIWIDECPVVNRHILFRKEVELAEENECTLRIAAESMAIVYLDGKEVHRTSSISYPGSHVYEEGYLGNVVPGSHVITIHAWYIGVPSGNCCPKDPGIAVELSFGDSLKVASDGSWQALPLDAWLGPHRRAPFLNLDLIEICDRRLLPEGWPCPTDPTLFGPAKPFYGARNGELVPRAFPKPIETGLADLKLIAAGVVPDLSSRNEVPAIAVTEEGAPSPEIAIEDLDSFTIDVPPAGSAVAVLFELGSYLKGSPELEITATAGAVLDISVHERMRNGKLDFVHSIVFDTDRFILAEGQNRIIQQEWKTGRFMQLTFRNLTAPVTVRDLKWHSMAYPLQQRARLRSSDKRLERIFVNSLNGAAVCMHDNIMDCPWRERRQWIGDIQRIALINHYGFGDKDLIRGVLKQAAQLQTPEGRIWCCLPLYEELPCQSMEWLRAVIEYTDYQHDTSLINELRYNIQMLHRWFLAQRDDQDLFFAPAATAWMDNPYKELRPYRSKTAFLGQNLRYLIFLDDIVEVFGRLSWHREAAEAAEERRQLGERIRPAFLDENGLYRDAASREVKKTYSEQGHALLVLADVGGDPASAFDAFQAYAAEHTNEVIMPSPFGKFYTLEALGRLGRKEAVMQLILDLWIPMVEPERDTSTVWESFGGETSLCHGWAGIPVVAIMRHVLELEPGTTPSAGIENIAGIDWVKVEQDL